MYTTIAQRAADPIPWLSHLIAQDVPAIIVEHFIHAARSGLDEALPNILYPPIDDERYGELAKREAIIDPSCSGETVQKIIKQLKSTGREDSYRFKYNLIPIDRMLMLLDHEDSDVRLATAIGEWQLQPNHRVRGELTEKWRDVIFNETPQRETILQPILTANPDLAYEWIRKRISEGRFSLWKVSFVIASVSEVLTTKQRCSLAIEINSHSRFDEAVFDTLVGTDDEVFRTWISSVQDPEVQVLALSRKLSPLWHRRATIAMDAGLSPSKIAGVVGYWGESWSGPQSAYFKGYLDAYLALQTDRDSRFHVIAAAGITWVKRRVDEAMRKEYLESI